VLSDILDESLVQLDVEASDWRDAVRKSTQPMVDQGKVLTTYVDDIIKGAEDCGPYFVLVPHVAMPHARPEEGAIETAVGVTILREPVEFGSEDNDPVKYLFPLSAKNSDNHLEALGSLAELLADEDFFERLDKAETPKDVVDLVHEKEGR